MAAKKKQKSELEKAKDRLWVLVSEYTRRKDADEYGNVQCVTCGTVDYWKNGVMQAGHFIPKSQGAYYRWCLGNIFAQCGTCNYGNYNPYRKGFVANETAKVRFTRYMEDRFGVEYVDYLLDKSDKERKYTLEDIERMTFHVKQKLKELDDV